MGREIYEERINEAYQESKKYAETRYAKWIEQAKNGYKECYGRDLPYHTIHNLVRSYRNMEEEYTKMFGGDVVRKAIMESTTTPDSINKFINHAFGLATAFLPGNIMEKFTSIQTMDKRVGEIFYMDILKGNNKGIYNVAGQPYMSAILGPRTGEHYSDKYIELEQIYTGDGSTVSFSGTLLSWKPIIAGSITVNFTIGGVSYSTVDNGSNILTPTTQVASGTIDYNTGAISIVFNGGYAPDNTSLIYTSYNYNSLVETGQIPEITAQLTSKFVTAQRRALNLKYMFDAALLLGKEHGVDMEAELLEKGTAGMMNEIAVNAANTIYSNAVDGGADMVFDQTPPSTNIPYITHRQEIVGILAGGALTIEQQIRYAKASFVIGGKSFVSLVRGLPNDVFNKANYDVNPVGMHVVGILDNQYEVIQNLDMPNTTSYVLGSMGQDFLHSGSVYAEFIPITVMNANWNDSSDVWRTAVQWSAFTIINSNFYLKGSITKS